MQNWEMLLLGAGLAMDAFAASICKGLAAPRHRWKDTVLVGLLFGGFQAAMPLAGYFLGIRFASAIQAFDHWIAFVLLAAIGINMIREARDEECEQCQAELNSSFHLKALLPLAVATSIDALAVGIGFAFLQVHILIAVCSIGIITFLLSCIGVELGAAFGSKWKAKAELAGGLVLIFIGTKILLEHLGFLG